MTLGSSNDPRGAGSLMEAGWQGAWAWAGPVASPAPRPHCQPSLHWLCPRRWGSLLSPAQGSRFVLEAARPQAKLGMPRPSVTLAPHVPTRSSSLAP